MTELIKEEILTTVKKKRFIIFTAFLFIGVIIDTALSKADPWNDLIYFFAIQDYIQTVFTPFMGIILILSVYRKKYTRTSILQVEEKGMKRYQGVFARVKAGCIILFCCYVLMALFVIALGLIFGANLTSQQTWMLMLRLLTDFLAAAAIYTGALFFLYLFAFPVFPMIWYGFFTFAAYLMLGSFTGTVVYRVCNIIIPKPNMDVFYTGLVMSSFRWECVLFLAAQILIPFLLTVLVFKLKKLKEEKAPAEEATAEAVVPVQTSEEENAQMT
jgi:ABC-type transport system involved in multi-copper enzyme maturation permease subunit